MIQWNKILYIICFIFISIIEKNFFICSCYIYTFVYIHEYIYACVWKFYRWLMIGFVPGKNMYFCCWLLCGKQKKNVLGSKTCKSHFCNFLWKKIIHECIWTIIRLSTTCYFMLNKKRNCNYRNAKKEKLTISCEINEFFR